MTIATQAQGRKNDGFTDYIRQGTELQTLIKEARELGGTNASSTWPYFVNRAYFYVDVE